MLRRCRSIFGAFIPSAAGRAVPPWQGAAMKPLVASIATGVILWFMPVPEGVSRPAWQLLSIFLAAIVGIITQPLPLGAVALMGLGAAVLTKTLTFGAAFSAFGDPIPWLIALAFFFARGFIKTGLGNRIAYQFVSLFGTEEKLGSWPEDVGDFICHVSHRHGRQPTECEPDDGSQHQKIYRQQSNIHHKRAPTLRRQKINRGGTPSEMEEDGKGKHDAPIHAIDFSRDT